MSHSFYAKEWLRAREEWAKLIEFDESVQNGKPIENENVAINLTLEVYYRYSWIVRSAQVSLYIYFIFYYYMGSMDLTSAVTNRYRKIIHRLTGCHDHIVQPQIREILGKMLDYSIVRMLEYRREIVALTLTECPWPIDTLLDLKLNPDDVDLRAPAYDAHTRKTEFERDKKTAEDLIANVSLAASSTLTECTSLETFATTTTASSRRKRAVEMPMEQKAQETAEEKAAREAREAEMKKLTDAVLLIESFERARIGRRDAKRAARRQSLDRKVAAGTLLVKRVNLAKQLEAAIVIQKTWRAFVARRQLKSRIAQLEEVIGMTIDSRKLHNANKMSLEKEPLEESQMRSAITKELSETFAHKKDKIWQVSGPKVLEDITDEVREWFLLWFNELGYFDSIPAAEDSGTLNISTGEIRTPSEYLAEISSPSKDKNNKSKDKEKDAEAEDGNEIELEIEGWLMPESKALPFLFETNEEFIEHWALRTEEILHPDAPIIFDLMNEQIYYELQIQMRKFADQKLRLELETLNEALKADFTADGNQFNPPKAQIFQRKNNKAEEKDRKGRERLDILGEKTSEELLVDLLRWKVIRECPQRNVDEWPAEVSLAIRNTWEIRLGDVKQPLMDYCILPIASKAVNELAPFVRSVCICGPPGSGQQFLAEAVCTELKATVFDLTPEKHVGRFLRKETQEKLVQSVLKLARTYAPSVVLVEGEKAWLKKVPAEWRRVNPKRFAKLYSQIVKGIKPGDQVLFLTTSTEPYMATRSFVKIHDKFIIIPVADYGSLYRLYKKALMGQPELDRHWEVSCLASLTAARTPLQVAENALATATGIARRCDFQRHPLTQSELLDQLELHNPLTSSQIDQFHKFRLKLPLERKRRILELEEEQRQQELKKSKKK